MKVMCIGFVKTGTKSLHAALAELGYNVYDYEEHFYYLKKEWKKILKYGGTKEDFKKMYEDVDAVIDIPCSYFWREILEAFPDAKLIFMKRENEMDWLKSWERQADSASSSIALKMLSLFSYTGQGIFNHTKHVGRVVFASQSFYPWQVFGGISKSVALKRYRDHNTTVSMYAPKDQLLNFKLQDGWEPLCKFLGKPVPDKPFPQKNKNASLVQDYLDESPIFAVMKNEMYISLAVIAAAFACVYFYDVPILAVIGACFLYSFILALLNM